MFSKTKNLLVALMVASIVAFNSPVNAAPVTGTASVQINSKVLEEKSLTGMIINNRTYVDLNGLLNCLPLIVNSKQLSFDSQSKTLKIYGEDFASSNPPLLQFHIGDNYFLYNGKKMNLDTNILLVNDRIQIPLKPVVSVFNLKVAYNKSINTVFVSE